MAMLANSKKFKVRTGCITCKIRKIKCDESKPECKRCTSTGRKCDGYVKLDARESEKQRSLVPGQWNRVLDVSNTLSANASALSGITSASECRWFEYFCQHAGPALSDPADRDFWTHILPQLSVSEPAIRHALLAIGSSYAQFETRSNNNNTMGVIEHNHSIKHYSLAITNLRRSLLQGPGDVVVPLICSLLFICLECLYKNQPLMLNHLSNGLQILSSSQSNSSDVATTQSIKQKLEQIFYRLDTQAALYGKPVFLPSGDPTLAFSLEIPSTFDDMFEAKVYLDTINSMSLNFILLAKDGTLMERYQNCSAVLLQRRLQEQFMAWRNTLDNSDHITSPKEYDYKDTATRLRIEYHASFIYLSNCLEMQETSYDAYKAQFAALVSLARTVLPAPEEPVTPELPSLCSTPSADATPVQSTGFSLEASLIPSLYFVAIKCRDPIIRRDAISLLERHNGREGLWDARVNWRLARRIVEIEEGSMLRYQGAAEAFMEEAPSMRMQASNGAVLTDLPSEEFRVLDGHIIKLPEEETLLPVQIAFYTRPDGAFEQGHVWREDMWF